MIIELHEKIASFVAGDVIKGVVHVVQTEPFEAS
jgi:hypothetical protein